MYELKMIRGDSKVITVEVFINESPRVFNSTDKVYFSMRENNTEKVVIRKVVSIFVGNKVSIVLFPEDSKELGIRKYKFDIRLVTKEGNVHTLVPMSDMVVLEEVTNV